MTARRKASDIDDLVGRNVARLREELGATQDDLAKALRESGWPASGLTVAALERGDRVLSVEEMFLLGDVLDVPATALFVGQYERTDEPITKDVSLQLGNLYPENAENIRKRLARADRGTKPREWERVQSRRRHVRVDTFQVGGDGYVEVARAREAEGNAAKRLGIEPDEVVRRSLALWNRTLTEERDARTAARIADDAPARSRTIVRGHVTRELLAELEQETEGRT